MAVNDFCPIAIEEAGDIVSMCPAPGGQLNWAPAPTHPCPPTLLADKPVDDDGLFDSMIQNENKIYFRTFDKYTLYFTLYCTFPAAYLL